MPDLSCPPVDSLDQLLADELPAAEAAVVRAHLSACDGCQRLLDQRSDNSALRGWAAQAGALLSPPTEPALERALLAARALGTTAPAVATAPGGPLTFLGPPVQPGDLGSLGPYRVLAELGRGGMGIVLRGYDDSLRRMVALKVLRPELADPDGRARLVREARLAARLRHDHVVPVYAVLDPPGGLPCVVMEFVAGPTLAQRAHAQPPLLPRAAAELVAQVADALAAAHAAGLVHRDVKPANVLLDISTGRARLADFGVARGDRDTTAFTRAGAVVGTPAYMSPEQARGEPADARADVYGLGATLYETLTGEAPFRGASWHQVLRQVLDEEPRPPRQLNEAVPRDLETVCLKAMAKEAHRPYATAADLAADLRRFLRGEPTRARPAGRAERLLRWARRNPRVAALSTALVLVLALGFAGVFWQWRQAVTNLAEARRHQDRAEVSARDAREAVERFHTRISEFRLLNEPGLQPLRKELLHDAHDFFTRFVRDREGDPGARADLARALFVLANITRDIESREKAIPLLEQAIALREQLAAEAPSNPVRQADLAHALNNRGNLYLEMGQLDRAEATHRRSLDLSQRLVAEHPAFAAGHEGVYRSQNNLGWLFLSTGQPDRAEDALKQAVAAGRHLAAVHPEEPRYRRNLVRPLTQLGWFHGGQGQLERAVAAHREALTVALDLTRDHPHVAEYQVALSDCYSNLVPAELLAGQAGAPGAAAARLAEAEKAAAAALAILRRLVGANPVVTEYQVKLADLLNYQGYTDQVAGRLDRAETAFREAQGIGDRLARDYPEVLSLALAPAMASVNLGGVLAERGRHDPALESLGRAITRLEDCLRRAPRLSSHRAWLASAYVTRALTLTELNRLEEADVAWGRGIVNDSGKYRRLREFGRALDEERRTGRDLTARFRALHAAAAAEARTLAAENPLLGGTSCFLARVHARAAAAVAGTAPAERYAARAIDLLKRARTAGCFRAPGRLERLRKDGALNALRPRRDFQDFLRTVETEAPDSRGP